MSENISDRNGRALEFAIVRVLLDKIPASMPLGQTLVDQKRDSLKFAALPEQQQTHFMTSAEAIFTWLANKHNIHSGKTSIERLTDDAAKKGDVTDIRLYMSGEILNLSVKNNHRALKHQRPGAMANQAGYAKNSPEDLVYRAAYKKITNDFLNFVTELKKDATNFSDLKALQIDVIDKNLYAPMCALVCDFLNTQVSRLPKSQLFFSFIVGMTDFHKVIVYPEKLEIHEFAFMPAVSSLSAVQRNHNYVDVSFSNGWVVSMRLHTASSKIKGVSLKFDTQLLSTNVPVEIIPLS